VNFESAGIGFVMSLNPAALAGAPHSHIATVYAEEEAEAQILRDLASAYPNITAIRIRDAIDSAAEVIEGIAAATRTGAGATLLTGFLVLIGAAAAGTRARTYEAAVLKTLGATRARILWSFTLRAAMLGGGGGRRDRGRRRRGLGRHDAGHGGRLPVRAGLGTPDRCGRRAGELLAGLGFALAPLAAGPARVLRARD
jgi:putative ABC transport system permease protein